MKERIRAILCGAAAGAANGLFGAGGGMVLVPLIRHFDLMNDRETFASAIAIIFPICVVSVVVYYLHGSIDLSLAAPYLWGGLAGGLIGGILYKRIPTAFLHKAFGALILWGGFRLLL